VLLTFSYLIVPAVAANYLASTFRIQWLLGWLLATLASVLSIVVTLKADLPLGAAIVCGLGLGLIAVMAVARFRNRAA
jgi:ABC-type Mn2+/Zn2+ transport system permease subunit